MLTIRHYQSEAIAAIAKVRRGIVVAPAGSGKTIIMTEASRLVSVSRIRTEKPLICFVAPTIDICGQILDAVKLTGLGEVASVDVCCYATTKLDSIRRCDCLILDEAHRAGSAQAQSLIAAAVNAKAVWGFTATPERSDEQSIEDVIGGRIVYRLPRQELVEAGNLTACDVRMIDLRIPSIVTQVNELSYSEIMNWHTEEQRNRIIFKHAKELGIVANEARNAAAICYVSSYVSQGRSVLCLVATIEQGKQIANVSSGQLLHSGTKKRRQIIDDFRAGKIKALICTSLADEGLDVPIASVLVMACGGRSSGKTEQRTGRVLRPHSGKESGIVVDFTDSHHPMLAAQSWARKKTYSKLNYKITK